MGTLEWILTGISTFLVIYALRDMIIRNNGAMPDFDEDILEHKTNRTVQLKHQANRMEIAERINEGERSDDILKEISKELMYVCDFGALQAQFELEASNYIYPEEATLQRIAKVFSRDITKFLAIRTGIQKEGRDL